MQQFKRVGDLNVSAIGLGCMSMSHGYSEPNKTSAQQTLLSALDYGYNFYDTAALYGFGENERLIGEVLKPHRDKFVLASKCGLIKGEDGKRAINGRPDVIYKTCEESLKNLQTDVIDLYYLHRVDPQVPIEESIGALAELVKQGKIRNIGLSEVSAKTLRRACREHPIAALQSEYSLWTRNPENEVLSACKDLMVTFIAFSPLARGFLTNKLNKDSCFSAQDLRSTMPRFQGDNYLHNLALLAEFSDIASKSSCTPAQLAIAWVMAQGEHIIPIPGTQHATFAYENSLATEVKLSNETLHRLDALINESTVNGLRYNNKTLATLET